MLYKSNALLRKIRYTRQEKENVLQCEKLL